MKRIETDKAPKAIGPYSQGVISKDKLIYVSGQLPIDPTTGTLIQGDIQLLTQQVIKNIEAILIAGGSSLDHVIRTEVFMIDLKEFKAMNEEYARHFKGPTFPARQTVQVAQLPLGSPIEISCIAEIS